MNRVLLPKNVWTSIGLLNSAIVSIEEDRAGYSISETPNESEALVITTRQIQISYKKQKEIFMKSQFKDGSVLIQKEV